MNFDITGAKQKIYTCTECNYCSTKQHFKSDTNEPHCILCEARAEQIDTIEPTTGMSAFKYQELLEYLAEEVGGVGTGTKLSIENHFEDGDDFLNAADAAYQEQEYENLTEVDGVGESTAESIALGIAEKEGWSGGKAEMTFDLA
jgi:hypothetical protein